MSGAGDGEVLTGGCQCGALRFQVTGPPTSVYVCHCRMCQKASGGPFGVFAAVPAAAFRWTRGAPAGWASSSLGDRQFCATCGTPVGYKYFAGPEHQLQFLTTGCFDDFRAVVPDKQVGSESRLDWVDDLAKLGDKPLGSNVSTTVQVAFVNFQHPDHDTPAGWRPDQPPRKAAP
jgi:hypothetical protein